MGKKIDSLLALAMKRNANTDVWDGRGITSYFQSCMNVDYVSGTKITFTRDEGMHSGGWWKNPDYERCYHLSVSFFHPISHEPLKKNDRLTEKWLKAFFGDEYKKLWCEPPYSDNGKSSDIWHYRLFCNEFWMPIIPRGEVYSTDLTEAGYKTFSEVQYEKNKRK